MPTLTSSDSLSLLIVDHYDSFTYNLVQCFQHFTQRIEVVRHDKITLQECLKREFTHLVISPGPGHPQSAKLAKALVKALEDRIPVLGVCLGHQAIAELYGAKIKQGEPKHGKLDRLKHHSQGLFDGIPQNFKVARYHSLLVDARTVPSELEVAAENDEGIVMALEHKVNPIYTLQFHPESIATEYGLEILENFLEKKGVKTENLSLEHRRT